MVFPVAILVISDENDRDFIERLYIRYHKSMYKMARSLSASTHEAEDAVSNACLSLIKKIGLLRQLENEVLEGYIIATVKNAVFALHRQNRKYTELDETSHAYELPPPDLSILTQCSIDELLTAVEMLSEDDAAVIRMKYFLKYTDNEIGTVFGIKEASVRARLSRARAKIKENLNEVTAYDKK